MPGQQPTFAWRGNRNELLANYLLSSIAAVTPVRRQDDYGLDLLCTLISQVQGAVRAGRAFGVQVKSLGQKSLKYGGLNKNEWKKYELEWLFGQDQPILVAFADPTGNLLNLYSTFRIWHLHWLRGDIVGQIELGPDENLSDDPILISNGQWRYDETPIVMRGNTAIPGDGISYRIPLGPPIVCISGSDTDDRLDELRQVLEFWLNLEYQNIALKRARVPYTWEPVKWETNQLPSQVQTYQAWNATKGWNIPALLQYIAPAIASLLHNLVEQKSFDNAAGLVPIAEWLEAVNCLDDEGKKRLAQIKSRIASPNPATSNSDTQLA